MTSIPSEVILAAQAANKKYNIAASVTLAQWCLESGYGKHMPSGSNNPFGIKALPGQEFVLSTTREVIEGQSIEVHAPFRKFASLADAFDYHAQLLATRSPYAKIKQYSQQPLIYVQKLTGIYATDPKYGQLLTQLIKQNNLTQYDQTKPPIAHVVTVAVVAASTIAVAHSAPAHIASHIDFNLIAVSGFSFIVGILSTVLVFTILAYRSHTKEIAMIRPEAQPLIDQVTALVAEAAKVQSIQTELDAANAEIASMKQNDIDTDAAFSAALGTPTSQLDANGNPVQPQS